MMISTRSNKFSINNKNNTVSGSYKKYNNINDNDNDNDNNNDNGYKPTSSLKARAQSMAKLRIY